MFLSLLPTLSVSLHFNSHFSGGPGLTGTRMFSFWILLELRMIEVVVSGDNCRGYFSVLYESPVLTVIMQPHAL